MINEDILNLLVELSDILYDLITEVRQELEDVDLSWLSSRCIEFENKIELLKGKES